MKDEIEPTRNRPNGRDNKGRFAPGNRGGPGNPHVRNVARFRSDLFDCVSLADFRAVIRKLVERAKAVKRETAPLST